MAVGIRCQIKAHALFSKPGDKRCRKCKQESDRKTAARKYLADAERQKQANKRYRHANPEKVREQQRRTYAKNPEQKLKSNRRWQENNPDKVRAAVTRWEKANPLVRKVISQRRITRVKEAPGDGVTTEQWRAIVEAHGGMCAYCLVKPYEHMEHVIPIAKGGAHDPTNVVPSCATCNFRKQTKIISPARRSPSPSSSSEPIQGDFEK